MVLELVKKIYVFYGTQSSAPCSQEPIAGLYTVPHEGNLDPFSSRCTSTFPAITLPSTFIRLKWAVPFSAPDKLPCGFVVVLRPAKRPARLTLPSFNYSGSNHWKYKLWGSRGNVVSAVTSLWAGRAGDRVATRQGILFYSKRPRLAPGAYITPYSVGTPACEAASSPLSNVEFKNGWSYNSTPPPCLQGVDREHCTYLLTYLLTYLFPYLLIYLLTYLLRGAEPFLRS